jgi:hypothetical protein
MKRCPECNSIFSASEKFCELDGATLSDAPDAIESAERVITTSSKSLTPLAAIAGLVIGVLLVLIYLVVNGRKVEQPVRASNSGPSVAQQQAPSRPVVFQPIPVESPSVEPSPSPSPSVQPSPSPSPTPKPIELSSSPISTTNGQDKTGPVTITLESGLTIDADEAWKTGEGIWYRKGGMVSLLNPKDIRTLEKKSR